MNLTWRVSLWLSGYDRPPFLLWVSKRRRRWPLGVLTTWRNRRGDLAVPANSPPVASTEQSERDYAIYLWPDRLRWEFWLAGTLILMPIFTSIGWDFLQCLPSLPIIMADPGCMLVAVSPYLLSLAVMSLLFLTVTLLAPYIVYSLFRVSVLDEVWETWPSFMHTWFQGIPQSGPGSCNARCRLIEYLPPCRARWDAVSWSPRASPQRSFIKAAIADLFRDEDDHDNVSIWTKPAFRRWLLIWCAPLWSAYLVLWSILIIDKVWCLFDAGTSLTFSAIGLLLFSLYFINRAAYRLNRWGRVTKSDLCDLPPFISRLICNYTDIGYRLSEGNVQTVLGVIQIALATLFLSALRLLTTQ